MEFLAIDDGSSWVKWATAGKSGQFPSFVKNRANTDIDGNHYPSNYAIKMNHYAVDASGADHVDTASAEYQTSEANLVLIRHAIRESGITGPLVIGVTLPLDRFFLGESINTALIERKKAQIMKMSVRALDGDPAPEVVAVRVYPEGMIGALSAIDQHEIEGSQIVCFDLGGYTTDVVLMDDTGRRDKSRTIPNGTIRASRILAQQIRDTNPDFRDISDAVAMKALRTGKVGKTDFSALVPGVLRTVISDAIREAEKLFSLATADAVIAIGGGAMLYESNGVAVENMLIPDNPQMANVLGVADQLAHAVETMETCEA